MGSQKYPVVVLMLDIIGIGHSELIDGEKLLGNWDSYYKCDLVSVKIQGIRA